MKTATIYTKIIQAILSLSVLLIYSCSKDEECRKDRYVALNVKFYERSVDATTKKTTISSLSVDSITIRGMKEDGVLTDTIFYDNQKKISSVDLHLNSFNGQSTFIARFNKTTDTITIYHTIVNEFLSLECGCLKVHTVDSVGSTTHFVDSMSIINTTVNTTNNAENLRLFHNK